MVEVRWKNWGSFPLFIIIFDSESSCILAHENDNHFYTTRRKYFMCGEALEKIYRVFRQRKFRGVGGRDGGCLGVMVVPKDEQRAGATDKEWVA